MSTTLDRCYFLMALNYFLIITSNFCPQLVIGLLSEQIIVGRPLRDHDIENESNKIITIDDYGALNFKNITGSYSFPKIKIAQPEVPQRPDRREKTKKLNYPTIGDDSLGSLPDSFQQSFEGAIPKSSKPVKSSDETDSHQSTLNLEQDRWSAASENPPTEPKVEGEFYD